MKKILIILLSLVIIGGGLYLYREQISLILFQPTGYSGELGISLDDIRQSDTYPETEVVVDIKIIAENLNIPWEIVFLPNGDMLVTERPGNLLRISNTKEIIPIAGVEHIGEGGLLGMTLHPNFSNNNYIYLYLTSTGSKGLINRVERYQLVGNKLSDRMVIIDNIAGAKYHDGGRIEFGPDNKLYITTGDATNEASARDLSSLSGKILRLNDDGSIPADNPYDNAVYSLGHRNPQGLAWDNTGRLWATEHGRSGVRSGLDELNIILAGHDYGWPEFEGDAPGADVDSPQLHSGTRVTWAPADAIYWDNSIFFTGLRGETLYEYMIDSGELKLHFREEFGRLRAMVLGPDEFIYISTSNTDGRGDLNEGDDKIIRINPTVFR